MCLACRVQPTVVGGCSGAAGGGAGGQAGPSVASRSVEMVDGGEQPTEVGEGWEEGEEEPTVVQDDDPDDPWAVPCGPFSVRDFMDWLSVDEAPWVSAGNLTRREVVAGVLALQQAHHLSNGVAEAFVRFIDHVVGDAASERLPQSWRDIERMLHGLIITAEKWCVDLRHVIRDVRAGCKTTVTSTCAAPA